MNKEIQTNQFILDNTKEQDSITVQKKQRQYKKKNGGYTIIELIVGISVVVAVVAGVIGFSGPIMTTVRTNTMTGELSTFQQKIHEVYNSQQNGYSGISAQELITSKAYPGSLNATTNSLTSSFAGKVTISSDDGAGTSFAIQYAGVPTGVCIAIIAKITSGGWNEIDVGGTAIWSGTSSVPTKAAMDTACGASPNVAMKFISN